MFALLALAACGAGGPEVKSVALPTGVTLEYTEQGDPGGIPVILLHGYADSRRSWDLVLPHLPSRYRVLALTQRGHGGSSRPSAGYFVDDLAGDVGAFLDALGIDRAFVVGHSMGSMVAQRFAIDHPGRLRGMILTGAFHVRRDNPILTGFWDEVVSRLREPVDPQFVHDFQRSVTTEPLPDDFFATVVGESNRMPGWIWKEFFRGFLKADLTAELNRIATPTLLIWGDGDEFSPRVDQDSLLARIRGARLVTYTGVGHAANWEAPRRFASDLVAFIDGPAGERTGGP